MASIADPRHVSVTPIGDFDVVDAPDGVQPGDILLAWVETTGDVGDIDLTGGSPWVPLAENTSEFDTRLYAQVAGPTNPTRYRVELGDGDFGMVALAHLRGATLAEIVVESTSGGFRSGGVPCPAAEPGIAGGVEIRVALAYNASVDIEFGGGYTHQDQAVDEGDAMYVGARTALSSADLPQQVISTTFALVSSWQAWTVIVTPADTVPAPPPVPAFAVRGRALYRYTAHDLLTGQYIDDLYPRDVEYRKKLREPGSFSGSLPIPNSRVARAVRRVIPKVRSDLTTGPGRVEIRIWRGGDLWGRYWLTGSQLTRGRDGKISITLRGSTLDAYWYSLKIRATLDGSDDEQIANARAFLGFALASADAEGLNITFQSGSSGVFRSFTAKPEDNTSFGRAIEEYSKSENGFEYFLAEGVDETGVVSTWRWASPRFDTGVSHVVSSSPHGGDIAEYGIGIDALRGGTDWRARGGTIQFDVTEDSFALFSDPVETPHRDAGWPRIDHHVDHPTQSVDADELTELAEFYAEVAGGALWVRTVTVILPLRPTLNMNSLGNRVRMLVTDVWHESEDGGAGLDISERILEIVVKTPGRGQGREEVTLTLESVEVP
jgi:hypothetical protein